jgi:hypothetical protein
LIFKLHLTRAKTGSLERTLHPIEDIVKDRTANRARERTAFQTPHYHPTIDLRADVAFVYGWDSSLNDRVQAWRERGYRTHFMTGAAWGHYLEYLDGSFDGLEHWDEAQVARNGEHIDHGNQIFYIVPTASYAAHLKALCERAINAGVEAVHLEEPEFWSLGGYDEAFKIRWTERFNEPWQAPHSSADAYFKSSSLKYEMYTALLEDVFAHAKRFAASLGRDLKCYVDSHSTINYAQWGIVSPASNLAHLESCDGYVCQVWTGTARTPNHARGIRSERTFETAYLEYAQMAAMVAGTNRKIWFLADPIEDDPNHDWDDYRRNYHATLIASLLHPPVNSFEVMPWPDRVFNHAYPQHLPENQRSRISSAYARELLTISNALGEMDGEVEVLESGTSRIGLCIADTLLFERGFLEPEQNPLRVTGDRRPPDQIYRLTHDTEMDGIFGLALPLLEVGIPLKFVHLEHAGLPGALEDFDVLILSYDDLKPPSFESHTALETWVRAGGVLVYVGDSQPRAFDQISSWWREAGFEKPVHHLLEQLGAQAKPNPQKIDNGTVIFVGTPAATIARHPKIADLYLEQIQLAHNSGRTRDGAWHTANALVMRRGSYVVMAGLSQGSSQLEGRFLDLLDGDLPVLERASVNPGEHRLLYDLERKPHDRHAIVTTGRIELERQQDQILYVTLSAPVGICGQLILALETQPQRVTLQNQDHEFIWDNTNNIARVWFDGLPTGLEFCIIWGDRA